MRADGLGLEGENLAFVTGLLEEKIAYNEGQMRMLNFESEFVRQYPAAALQMRAGYEIGNVKCRRILALMRKLSAGT